MASHTWHNIPTLSRKYTPLGCLHIILVYTYLIYVWRRREKINPNSVEPRSANLHWLKQVTEPNEVGPPVIIGERQNPPKKLFKEFNSHTHPSPRTPTLNTQPPPHPYTLNLSCQPYRNFSQLFYEPACRNNVVQEKRCMAFKQECFNVF